MVTLRADNHSHRKMPLLPYQRRQTFRKSHEPSVQRQILRNAPIIQWMFSKQGASNVEKAAHLVGFVDDEDLPRVNIGANKKTSDNLE